MSNNIKKIGLDYFSVDTDIFSDEKMQYITAKFGVKGEAIIFRLMARIYRQGYYYQWNEDQCLLLSMSTGGSATAELIQDVVEEAAKRSFFDQVMLNDYGILTSRRIQTHYLFSTRRRKVVDIMSTFMMVDEQDVNIVGDNVNIKQINVIKEGTKHSIEQNSTEKNRKEDNNIKKVNTLAKFVSAKEDILAHAKKLYPDKDNDKAIADFIEACEIKGYKYDKFDMAFYKWVRDDRFDQYSIIKPEQSRWGKLA